MNDDRRTHEASSLRAFFDEQIHYLQELVGGLGSHIREEEQLTAEDRRIVETFVDASNSRMRAVHGYSHKLRDHIRALYNHILQIADQIPPPIDLTPDAFRTVPLVNALFVYSKDIDRLFKTDQAIEAYLRAHDNYQVPVLYALLTAGKSETHAFGIGLLGDMLVRDVSRQTVNFSSHKIHCPCASSAELGTALKNYLFDGVVALVKQEMASRMADKPFIRSDERYESKVRSLANPEVYLKTLIEYLETPGNLLRIDKTHFKLNKLGIKLESDDKQCANEFDIHELTWKGNIRQVLMQIAYARQGHAQ